MNECSNCNVIIVLNDVVTGNPVETSKAAFWAVAELNKFNIVKYVLLKISIFYVRKRPSAMFGGH